MGRLACVLALALLACDKGPDRPATRIESGAPEVTWREKNHLQRMEFMGLVVYPSMKQAFAGFDAQRFAEFECETCHGDDAKAVNYHMPNALTPLSRDDPHGDARGIDEDMTTFMIESVVPRMRAHLTDEHVTCHTCHSEERP